MEPMKAQTLIARLAGICQSLLAAGGAMALLCILTAAAPAFAATVTTDQEDYAPYSLVYITGS